MTTKKTVSDEKYEGVSKATEVLGVGHKWGLIGGFGGFAAGALFSGSFIKAEGDAAKSAQEFLQKFKINIGGKTAIMLAGGALVSKITHWVLVTYGYREGTKVAGKGEAQFNRLKTELNETQSELDSLKEGIGALDQKAHHETKHTDKHKPQGTHADAVLSDKESATEIAR